MQEGLNTRQINALRLLLERREFTPEDVAALDYHLLARMPGIGGKSLNIIREWLASKGMDLLNSPEDYSKSLRSCRLEARLERARKLLEKHGYDVRRNV
ncbi:MAG: hypothetical protein H6R19_1805 [Proteobacteria bacterium]|nr:hypothetical protein [Pseudomonadota bacterium]